MNGVVKCFHENKAFGYIEQENGSYVFVHFSSINCTGLKKFKREIRLILTSEGAKKIQLQ